MRTEEEHQQHTDFCAAHPQRAALGECLGGWREQFEQRQKLQKNLAIQQLALQTLQQDITDRSRLRISQHGLVNTAALAKADAETAQKFVQAEQDQRLAGQTLAALRLQWPAEQGHVNRWQQLEALARQRRELASQQTTLAADLQQGEATTA